MWSKNAVKSQSSSRCQAPKLKFARSPFRGQIYMSHSLCYTDSIEYHHDMLAESDFFDNFFKYNPDVVRVREKTTSFQLKGFCMDFSDAQFIGLGLAYGKLFLRGVHKDQRHDFEVAFLSAARPLGEKFVEKYCKGCEFHYAQSVRRVSMHVHVDDCKREEFKALAFKWQKAPIESKDGVPSANQVVAEIDSKFPLAKTWTKWWRKRAHLIMEADMSLTKSEDIMKSYPTTNNNIESFHAHFKHAVPRQHLPLFLAVRMAYHFAKNCEIHAKGIKDGTRKPNRKRGGPGSQHERRKLPIAYRTDEWPEGRPPENSKALKRGRKKA